MVCLHHSGEKTLGGNEKITIQLFRLFSSFQYFLVTTKIDKRLLGCTGSAVYREFQQKQ